MLTKESILQRIMYLVPLVLSLTVHEWAHAWSAFKLGDDTAAREGRLTLNPLDHIDPFGTILLPLLGIPFGWAKPVPVNPARFRREVSMTTGMAITASAGPVSNLLIAIVCAVIYGLGLRFGRFEGAGAVESLLGVTMMMNIGLAVFNLLPIPPLDGSRIAERLVPYRHRALWDQYARYGMFILLAVIIFGRSWIAVPIEYVWHHLQRFIYFVAGYS